MDQTGSGIAMIQLLISLPVFLIYACVFGELPTGLWQAFQLRGTVLYVFLFLGLMGTLISMSYNNLYKLGKNILFLYLRNILNSFLTNRHFFFFLFVLFFLFFSLSSYFCTMSFFDVLF